MATHASSALSDDVRQGPTGEVRLVWVRVTVRAGRLALEACGIIALRFVTIRTLGFPVGVIQWEPQRGMTQVDRFGFELRKPMDLGRVARGTRLRPGGGPFRRKLAPVGRVVALYATPNFGWRVIQGRLH